MTRRVAATAALVVGLSGAGSVPVTAATSSSANGVAAPSYRKAPTVACLRRQKVVVTGIAPADRRLRALRDLAQKTSWQAKLGTRVVGVSLNADTSSAELLEELLRVPRDPYRLERRSNALLLYKPTALPLARIVRTCLR
jgi:hypothetical protein